MSRDVTLKLRVLFAPETFNLGETSRGVEVARALRRDGHEVLFMGYSKRFASYVTDAGFELELQEPELSEADADRLIAVDQGRGVRHPFTERMLGDRVDSELALIARWKPDVVVIGTTLSLFISARAAGISLVYVRPYPMSRGHLAVMTEFPLVQGAGPIGKTINRVAGWVVPRIALAIRWKPAAFRRVAARHGVRLPDRSLEAIDADLNLIASLFPAVDGRKLAENEVAVGPLYARPDGELPEEVRALVGRTRPVIYVGLGSSAGRRLTLDVLGALGDMDVDVITSAASYLRPADLLSLPDNVQAYHFLPAHRLGGLIDASVIHGGEGTVQTACAAGVPFAGIGLQTEQRFNIDECVRNGNALRFTNRTLRRGQLRQVVEQLLHDPDLQHAARDLAETMNGIDGAARSAEAIFDAFLASGS